MKSFFAITQILIISSLTFSCAAKRKTEPVNDFDDNRYPKAPLLSSPQWMYKATVVETSQEGGFAFAGVSTPMQVGFFEFDRNKLQFVNSVSSFSDGGKGVSDDLINSWSITHSEYRLMEVNGKVTNVEQENPKIAWSDKSFFKIDWTSQARNEISPGGSACFTKVQDALVEGSQELSDEHFTFTVETVYEMTPSYACASYSSISRRVNSGNFTYTVKVKHSFAPLPKSDYKPFVYVDEFDPRRKKYGFFETVVDSMNDETGRFEKSILVNRWHPEKEHTIYFSEDFPEDYKWIYDHPTSGVGALTNKLLAEHGLKMRFNFKSDPSVKYGDVRYSFVKFVDKPDESAPFGYGPSDAHPLTGEILRSDSLVWTSSLKYYVDRIKTKIDFDATKDQSLLKDKMSKIFERAGLDQLVDPANWTKTANAFKSNASDFSELRSSRAESRSELQKIIGANLYSNPFWAYSTYKDPFERFENNSKLADSVYKTSFAGGSVGRSLDLMTKANVNVPEAALSYLNEVDRHLKAHTNRHGHSEPWRHLPVQKYASTIYPLEPELATARSMLLDGKTPQQVIDTILYRVAIHEFGHNLSLRHNFYGSVDYKNFDAPRKQIDRHGDPIVVDGKSLMTQPVSSSVMDYLGLADEYNGQQSWEAYDRAALVYAYSTGDIDLDTHEVKLEGAEVRLTERAQPKGLLYCTDEQRAWMNPFCNAFDKGTTASEIVLNGIETYDSLYEVRNKRYGRAYWSTAGYAGSVAADLLNPLKFLKLYEDIDDGSWLTQMTDFSEFAEQGRLDDMSRIQYEIKEDSKRAASLLAAFYGGVIQLSNSERNIIDNVDSFTGNVTKIGILYDKLYAMIALGGSQSMSISNNNPPEEVNFLRHLNDESDLGQVLKEALVDIAVDNVELVVRGFESFGRSLYAQTASVDPTMVNEDFIGRMKILCYTKDGLRQTFGIDTDAYYPYFQGNPKYLPLSEEEAKDYLIPLEGALVKVGGTNQPLVGQGRYPVYIESDFSDVVETDLAIVRVGADYYVAPRLGDKEGYAFEFMRRGIEDDNTVSSTMQQYILDSKVFYDYARYGQQMSCIDYNMN